MTKLTPELIHQTRDAIKNATLLTPLVPATRLSLQLGIDLHLKLENLQHTNAFKARGALAKLLTLTDAQKANGVIACSAGNHAQGVAYHATRLGIASTIVMPEATPFNKVKRTEDFGAKVILYGSGFDDSVAYTLGLADHDKLTFIHPFDDPQPHCYFTSTSSYSFWSARFGWRGDVLVARCSGGHRDVVLGRVAGSQLF